MLTLSFVRSNLLYCVLCIGGFCLLISGNLLRLFGVYELFRDPTGSSLDASIGSIFHSRAFAAQFYTAIFISTVFICFLAASREQTQPKRSAGPSVKTAMGQAANNFLAYIPLPLLVLISATLLANDWSWPEGRDHLVAATAGLAFAQFPILVWFYLLAVLNSRGAPARAHEVTLLVLAALFVVCAGFALNPLTPADAFFTIFGWVTLAYLVLFYAPAWLFVACVGVLIIARLLVGLLPPEPGAAPYQLAGMRNAKGESYYKDGNKAVVASPSPGRWTARACGETEGANATCRLQNPVELLTTWQKQRGLAKPKIVLVAASGGAYQATFWTAHVLDYLTGLSGAQGELEGLVDHIRLMTGASGGMVGVVYFAVCGGDARPGTRGQLARIIERDVIESSRRQMRPHGYRGHRPHR